MMSSSNARNYRFPFTASQWQELEHQALIFKYMVSGMPIPPDLLYTIRRSLDSSLSSKLLLHQPQHIGWNCFQMGFGRKIDPEPGRCRRTDGKKWRCSKEAYPDSKYCERHMHRGRNRSRKPVEVLTTTTPPPSSSTNTSTPLIPISSITKNANPNPNPSSPTSHSLSCLTSVASEPHHHHNHASYTSTTTALHHHHPFLYPPHSSSRPPPGSDLPSQENTTTNFLLESGPYSHAGKGCYSSYGQVPKEEVDEHVFLSEASGTMRNVSDTSLHDSWQLTMGSPLKHRSYSGAQSGHSSYLQLNDTSRRQKQDHHHHYYALGCDDLKNDVHVPLTTMMERGEDHHQQPKKVMHHFFDEWPPKDKDSWIDADDNDNDNNNNSNIKLGRNHQHHHQAPASKIQLSISMPNTSHDFFMTRNGT